MVKSVVSRDSLIDLSGGSGLQMGGGGAGGRM